MQAAFVRCIERLVSDATSTKSTLRAQFEAHALAVRGVATRKAFAEPDGPAQRIRIAAYGNAQVKLIAANLFDRHITHDGQAFEIGDDARVRVQIANTND